MNSKSENLLKMYVILLLVYVTKSQVSHFGPLSLTFITSENAGLIGFLAS